ncbi:hypothetical protein MK489_17290 [Myxococcota bacterium]|nr:hypothetical protein [Myxococcota bacterium]
MSQSSPLPAAQRLIALADDGSLLEIGGRARSQQPSVAKTTPADGVHVAFARIHGREALLVVENRDALAHSDREVARNKLIRALDIAMARRLPTILVLDAPEGPLARFEPATGELHGRMSDPSLSPDPSARQAPLLAITLGPVRGLAMEWHAQADLVISTTDNDPTADIVASDEHEALECGRRVLAWCEGRPHPTAREGRSSELPEQPFSVAETADSLTDPGTSIPLSSGDAVMGCLARVEGWPTLFLGAQGPLSSLDLDRIRRSVDLSGRLGTPLVLLQDCPGYAPSAANNLEALARLTASFRRWSNPRVAVVCGAGHVLGSFALGARPLGLDFAIAWPWARLALNDPPTYDVASLERERQPDPWVAAGLGLVEDVLTPQETADTLKRLVAMFHSPENQADTSTNRYRIYSQ